ncbi:MAG: hypothetical protein WCK21_09285, partial [Actinomycetota bacterium]
VTLKETSETAADGITRTVRMATATIDAFRLSLGNYTFVARLVPEEAGMTVHTAPGQSLEGWVRPAADDQSCDHCRVKRNRVNLFVVRDDETGQFIQLGQQCIALYTGIEPKGLWALDFDGVIGAAVGGYNEGAGRSVSTFSIDQVLGLSMALTNGGKGYVSRARAEEWGKNSTAGDVRRCLFNQLPSDADCRKWPDLRKERDRLLQAIADGMALAKDEALMAEIRDAATTLKAGTDYSDNMAIILAAESGQVSGRNIGTLASLVAIHYRLTEERSAPKAVAAQGFIGEVGERVRDFFVTATMVREFDGDFGTTTLLVGTTDDGHVVKWFASGARDWEPGVRIHFTAATVKAQEQYKSVDQTSLTRGHKVEVVTV